MTNLATAKGNDARGGAWQRVCLRHRQGWLSLEEVVQIRWFPDRTATANDGRRLQTTTDSGKCCLTVLGSSKGQWAVLERDELSLDSRDD